MRDVFGDKGIHRQRPLELGYVASAGGGHDDDVLAAKRVDRRLEQPAQIGVVDGALGDVDDGAVTVEL